MADHKPLRTAVPNGPRTTRTTSPYPDDEAGAPHSPRGPEAAAGDASGETPPAAGHDLEDES